MATVMTHQSQDVDDQTKALTGWEQSYEQPGCGRFRGSAWPLAVLEDKLAPAKLEWLERKVSECNVELRALHLNKARRTLKARSQPPITELANTLGFSSASHFTRHDKLMFDELPSQTLKLHCHGPRI